MNKNNLVLKNLLRFLFLALLQVLVVNHIHIANQVSPYIYILAIMMLPFSTPRWLLLVSAFALGFVIDIFSGTMGLHIAATVFIAFIRPFLLNMMSAGREYSNDESPTIRELGLDWFIAYAAVMILLHHTVLFFLEAFKFDELGVTLLQILYSSLATFVLVVFSQFFFGIRKK